MGATESGFHSLVMAVRARLSSLKFCSLEIESGTAVRMTSDVAWVLHRAGFYLPSSDRQSERVRAWSFDRLPISLGNAEMVMACQTL